MAKLAEQAERYDGKMMRRPSVLMVDGIHWVFFSLFIEMVLFTKEVAKVRSMIPYQLTRSLFLVCLVGC
jgi:hypothetical protein